MDNKANSICRIPYFKIIDRGQYGDIVVEESTSVMYWRAASSNALTLLVNDEGKPMLWKETVKVTKSLQEAKAEKAINTGAFVTFGAYPQTHLGTDKTPIEWLILDVQKDKALVISKYALDWKPFDTKKGRYWETCTLRTWLNDNFISEAFSVQERQDILDTWISDSTGWKSIRDRLFILSEEEVEQYFGAQPSKGGNMKLRVEPTEYTIARGAYLSDNKQIKGKPTTFWWLRSSGRFKNMSIEVDYNGEYATPLDGEEPEAVRPAFWIALNPAPLNRYLRRMTVSLKNT